MEKINDYLLAGVFVALILLVITGIRYSFAQPTAAPGTGPGVYLPVNVGPDAQTKAGNLTVSGILSAANLNITTFNADEICLAGDCLTTWPGRASATVSGAAYANILTGGAYSYGYYCANYSYYNNLQFYYYGTFYTQNTYNCGSTDFAVIIPSTLPAGATILETTNAVAWCHSASSDYHTYPISYINDTYHYYRTAASNIQISTSGDNLTVAGTCTFFAGGSNTYAWMAVRLESADILYSQ